MSAFCYTQTQIKQMETVGVEARNINCTKRRGLVTGSKHKLHKSPVLFNNFLIKPPSLINTTNYSGVDISI